MMEKTISTFFSRKKWTLSLAESCTGGLIASSLTDIPGSSGYFKGGVVAYSNQAKQDLLNVPASVLKKYGAVSQETAMAMASGARHVFKSDASLSVTGIAGPTGGTLLKPVGTVFMAVSFKKKIYFKKYQFRGSRQGIKTLAKNAALNLLKTCLEF